MNPFALAAVDGSEESYAAVAFAAEESLRRGLRLHIAHVMPAELPIGRGLVSASDPSVGAFAAETLASARRVAEDLAPGVLVSTQALAGGRVSQILKAAEHAELVALGRRRATALDRAWSGGTLDAVASRAPCPVVVVPALGRRPGAPRRVVLGFKHSRHAAELFEAGFRIAAELDAEVSVLHAWKLSLGYDDIVASKVSEASSNRDHKDVIWELLTPWIDSYPGVPVRIQVVHEYPVRALVEASRDADRLVLVRTPHGASPHHLGRTARGALRFAQCPVEVVPARRGDDLVLPPVSVEESGHLVP